MGTNNFNLNVSCISHPCGAIAQEGARPVLNRTVTNKNNIDMGNSGTTENFYLSGFEVRGGSAGIRMHRVKNVAKLLRKNQMEIE